MVLGTLSIMLLVVAGGLAIGQLRGRRRKRSSQRRTAVPDVGTEPMLKVSPDHRAMLLRVVWLAIALGLLLQLALLLAAVGFDMFAGLRPLVAETVRNVGWSVIVCTGIAIGRVLSKGRTSLMGIAGLLAAPIALDVANVLQKSVAEALDAAGPPAGFPSVWVMLIRAAEYGCLGIALGWLGGRAWGGALAHALAGLLAGIVFGTAMLALVMQSAPMPLTLGSIVGRGINELVFPIGCALVVFTAEILGGRAGAGSHPEPPEGPAHADQRAVPIPLR